MYHPFLLLCLYDLFLKFPNLAFSQYRNFCLQEMKNRLLLISFSNILLVTLLINTLFLLKSHLSISYLMYILLYSAVLQLLLFLMYLSWLHKALFIYFHFELGSFQLSTFLALHIPLPSLCKEL